MPLPSVSVTLDDRITIDGHEVPTSGVYVTSTGRWADQDPPSIRDTILRTALHRPCTNQVMAEVCASLERLLRTRVSLRIHEKERHVVHGIRGPIGFTRGRDSWIDITVELATVDQLQEIQATLREIVPAGIEVHVQAGDGRTADREEWHDEYARRAYGIERREPAPRIYDLGDGLRVNFGEGTYVGDAQADLRARLRQELPRGVATVKTETAPSSWSARSWGSPSATRPAPATSSCISATRSPRPMPRPSARSSVTSARQGSGSTSQHGSRVVRRANAEVENIKVELRVEAKKPGRTVWEFLLEDDPLEEEAA